MVTYDDDECNDGLLTEEIVAWQEDQFQHQLRYTRAIIIPWVLSLVFFCATCLFC
jgi:hypothetical protein